MKNSFKYIKNIFKVLIWPIIFMVGQFFIQYIFVAIFNSNERGTFTEKEFLEHIKTEEYITKLNNYINSNTGIESYQIEMGYIKTDSENINNNANLYAEAITNAIEEFLNNK